MWMSAPLCSFLGLQEDPPLLPFLILVHVGLFLACFSHSSLSQLLHSGFCPFCMQALPEVPSPWLQGSAMPRLAGAGWRHLCLAWDSPGLSSQGALQPPATSVLPHIPQMLIQTERRENNSDPVYSCGL